MDARGWAYNRLSELPEFVALVPMSSVYAAGSLTGSPATKPFVVVRLDTLDVELNDADVPHVARQNLTFMVHDEPGSYVRIDAILGVLRRWLPGSVPSAIACTWLGDSGDLAEDTYGTIMKQAVFQVTGGV